MRTRRLASLAFALSLSALAAESPAANRVGRWTPNGHPVCTAPGDQRDPRAVPDGEGGCIVVWNDDRFGPENDLFAIRLDREGNVAPGWVPDGNPVCVQAGAQNFPQIVSDGAGGAWISWNQDSAGLRTIRLQHVLADGAVAPGWPANGRRVIPTGAQGWSWMDDDDAGGTVLAWERGTGGATALRLTPAGSAAPGWPAEGVVVWPSGAPFQVVAGANGAVFVTVSEWLPPCIGHGCPIEGSNQVALVRTDGARVDLLRVASGSNMRSEFWIDEDGSGGVVGAHGAIFQQRCDRFDAAGAMVWSAFLPNGPGPYELFALMSDGSGGAWCAYERNVVRSVRIDGAGAVATGWAPDGNVVCGVGTPRAPLLVRDGFGGAFVAWRDHRASDDDLYAVRLTGSGTVASGWTPDGDIVSDGPGSQERGDLIESEPGAAIVLWTDTRSGSADIYGQRLAAENPTPVALALVDARAESGRVRLSWQAPGASVVSAALERRTVSTSWIHVADVVSDGTGAIRYEDTSVAPGARYGYRLVIRVDGLEEAAGETWITVPSPATVRLRRLSTNPSVALVLEASMPEGEAGGVELADVAGRRVASRPLPGGVHRIGFGESLPPGLYLARLRCPAGTARLKVCVMR